MDRPGGPPRDDGLRPLRRAGLLLAVLATAWLLWMGGRAPAGDDGGAWPMSAVAAAAVLVALSGGLWSELMRRAGESRALARRVDELQGQVSRATRQRHELLEKVSHDLRTPLASMQGYLELLLLREQQLDPAEARNYLQTATRHAQRLAQRVADLFELVRLESDTVALQREPFPVAELAHDVVQRYADAAARAGIALALEGVDAEQARGLFVEADVRLVERLLANLVDNALRHTPAGGAVRVIAEAPADARVAHLTVADTGAGITGADLEGLFDRYETADRVGDTGSSHAGLGLAIARRIAVLHGSDLELDSQPGVGTRVRFTLPRPPQRAAGPQTHGSTP